MKRISYLTKGSLYQTRNPFDLAKFARNYLRFGVFGHTLRIEASTLCQLKCPGCWNANKKKSKLGEGYLKLKDFEAIIKKNPWIRKVEFSNFGEPLLNPELDRILNCAHKNNIRPSFGNGVNLNLINHSIIKAIVSSKTDKMLVSIDGATDEVYQKYRKGGSLPRVLANIEKINKEKIKQKSTTPRLVWQFLVFEHNRHEIDMARQLAQRYRMDFLVHNSSEIMKKRSRMNKKNREFYNIFSKENCHMLWTMPQVNYNGDILGCCQNQSRTFGNILKTSTRKLLTSRPFKTFKKDAINDRKALPCADCSFGKYR